MFVLPGAVCTACRAAEDCQRQSASDGKKTGCRSHSLPFMPAFAFMLFTLGYTIAIAEASVWQDSPRRGKHRMSTRFPQQKQDGRFGPALLFVGTSIGPILSDDRQPDHAPQG